MTWQIKLTLALGLLLAGFGSGFCVRTYMAHADQARADNSALHTQLAQAADYAKKLRAAIDTNVGLNAILHAIDVTNTRNLNAQLNENARLRVDLATAQRMRFTGAVCPKPGTAQAAGGPAAGVDDGAGIELTAEGRQDVFNLRADIIADRNKLAGLQAYIHGLEARGIIGSSTIAVADPPPSSTLVLH